jgi:Uma2 family endonuclease
VIEIVSPSSRKRDHEEKPEEYFQFGILEYWIIDAAPEKMLDLRRAGGRWLRRVVKPGEVYQTRRLPGLDFDCAPVFQAVRAAGG